MGLEQTAPSMFHKFSTSWMHLGSAPGQAWDGCYPSFCACAPQTRLLVSTEYTYSDPLEPQKVVWPASEISRPVVSLVMPSKVSDVSWRDLCGCDQVHFGRLDIDITLYLTSNCFEGCGFKGSWFQMRNDNSSLVVGSNLQSGLAFWYTQWCWVAIFQSWKRDCLLIGMTRRCIVVLKKETLNHWQTDWMAEVALGSTEVCHDAPPGWWLLCQYVHQPHEGHGGQKMENDLGFSPLAVQCTMESISLSFKRCVFSPNSLLLGFSMLSADLYDYG